MTMKDCQAVGMLAKQLHKHMTPKNFKKLMDLMEDTCVELEDDPEVSGKELDWLVEFDDCLTEVMDDQV